MNNEQRSRPTVVESMSKPNEDVVELCRNLLERAESGEIRAIATCGLLTGFRGFRSYASSDEADQAALLGELGLLKHRMTEDRLEREEEG